MRIIKKYTLYIIAFIVFFVGGFHSALGAELNNIEGLDPASSPFVNTAFNISSWHGMGVLDSELSENLVLQSASIGIALQATSTETMEIVIYAWDSSDQFNYGAEVGRSDQINKSFNQNNTYLAQCHPISAFTAENCLTEFTFSTPPTLVAGGEYLITIETSYGNSIYWFYAQDVSYLVSNPAVNAMNFCSGGSCTQVRATRNHTFIANTGGFSFEEQSNNFNNQFNTRFVDFEILTDNTMKAHYNLDVTEVDPFRSDRNPTVVTFEPVARGTTTQETSISESIDNTVDGISISTTNFYQSVTFLASTTYDVFVHFDNIGSVFGSTAQPFAETYLYASFDTDGVGAPIPATLETELYDNLEEPETIAYQECGISKLTGCLNNSFRFLFVPSPSSLQGFTTVNEDLSGKLPFIYVYQMKENVESLFDDTSTTTPTITVPFGVFGSITLLSESLLTAVPFQPLIRSIIGYLIWIMFIGNVYRRTLTIFNQTPSS